MSFLSEDELFDVADAVVGDSIETTIEHFDLDGHSVGWLPTGLIYVVAPACYMVGARTCVCYHHGGRLKVRVPLGTLVRRVG